MQYYNIAVEDSIAEKVLAFLKSFPQKQVEISKSIEVPQVSPPKIGTITGKRQAGILAGYTVDPAFYEPLDDDELARW